MKLSAKKMSAKTRKELALRADQIAHDDDCKKTNWTLFHLYFLLHGFDAETNPSYQKEYNLAIEAIGNVYPELVLDEK